MTTPATRKLIAKIYRLPRYPFHTWDRKDDGNHQELIGLADVVRAIAEQKKDGKS